MISETLSLLASMFDAIGPGFLFVLALPLFLVGLAVVLLAGFRRPRTPRA